MGFFVDFLDEAFNTSNTETRKRQTNGDARSLNESSTPRRKSLEKMNGRSDKGEMKEELQLSGVKELNGKNSLRYKRKENIKTSGKQRTGVSGDRDMRESKEEEKYTPRSRYGSMPLHNKDDYYTEMREYFNHSRNVEANTSILAEDFEEGNDGWKRNRRHLTHTALKYGYNDNEMRDILTGKRKA